MKVFSQIARKSSVSASLGRSDWLELHNAESLGRTAATRLGTTQRRIERFHKRCFRSTTAGIGVGILICVLARNASGQDTAAAEWQALTRIDLEAAYDLLRDNHPANTIEANDQPFRDALASAHERALARIATVESLEGYTATLGEFANSMGDGHIASNSLFLKRTVRWAGLIAAKRGGHWVVANDDRDWVGANLIGYEIVSCDGEPAAGFGANAMHFRVVPSDDALRASWLLVDEGNPFLKPPASCVFLHDGTRSSLTLKWTNINRALLIQRYFKASYGQAGFGLRPSGDGWWIALQGLSPEAQPVIDAVRQEQAAIRSAPYVVVDLRGDGGGDSAYGRALAEALYGSDFVDTRLGPPAEHDRCPSAFRASPGNIEAISALRAEFQKSGDTSGERQYAAAIQAMKAAASAGHALSGSTTCAVSNGEPNSTSPSPIHGRVFVLTDAACFSSCVSTVGYFRKLGAIQVGLPTGAVTHYSEVREIMLPSGLSTFSTLQAIMTSAPHDIGPYSPAVEFEGDIADSKSIENWIASLWRSEVGRGGEPK